MLPSKPYWTGAPSFLLHDGLRNKYFRLSREAIEILSLWQPIEISKLTAQLTSKLHRKIEESSIIGLAEFLHANSLTDPAIEGGWQKIFHQSQASKQGWFKAIIHHYLFFRLPLARPQKLLDICWPFVAFLFTRQTVFILVLLGLVGLFMVSRQWDFFVSTFLDFLTLDGFIIYGFSLVFIKIIHELGHAFMARRYRVEVPVIGVAFMVMMPILYTDTTGAHRLQSKQQRLMIDLAGIFAELSLASIATIFWVFLPDGPMRSVAFSTATLSWVLSLAVNLNPFMRFDGYYILSDMTGMENLQERSFGLAKWRMREALFGLGKSAPELLPSAWRRLFILHAFGTWIYRFFLFLGIAVLVYAFFIKLVGIMLFAVEILWFILLPVWREIQQWWKMKEHLSLNRNSLMSMFTLFSILVLFFIPWSGRVEIPAVIKNEKAQRLYSGVSGQIIASNLVTGRAVSSGEILMQLASPDLEEELEIAEKGGELIEARLRRAAADSTDRSLLKILQSELQKQNENILGIKEKISRLQIVAPIDGVLVDVALELRPDRWISKSQTLATLYPKNHFVLKGYVNEINMERIGQGTKGQFFADNIEISKFPVVVAELGNIAVQTLDQPLLADLHGGRIAAMPPNQALAGETPVDQLALQPRGTWFPLTLYPQGTSLQELGKEMQITTGLVVLEGQKVSFAQRTGRRIISVFWREFGL